MFEQVIDRVLRYVAHNLGVRIVGASGSGRTSVAKRVVEELEGRGTRVYAVFATQSLAGVPFAGIVSMGIDLRPRASGILGIADLLSEHVSRIGPRAIVVDGIESLDRESLAVIDIVQKRTEVPLIATMSDVPFESRTPAVVLGRWPEATVSLAPLRYEQVNALLLQMLGAPAEVDVPARILAKSGGNLRLAVRIIETAVLSERLVLRDGKYGINGSLMNEHLHGTVESLLHGLRPEEFKALTTLSVLGPTPVPELVISVGADVLDSLEHRRFVSAVPGPDGQLFASVFPPVVEDYLANHVLNSRRILRDSLTGGLDALRHEDELPLSDGTAAAELVALREEHGGSHAATVRYFHKRLESVEQLYYAAWEAERTMSNAVAFLRVYWGAALDRRRIRRVFELTDPTGEPSDLLFFNMTRALWAVMDDGDLHGGLTILEDFAEAEPEWAEEARAFSLLVRSQHTEMPADLDAEFARLPVRQPTSGVIAVARGLLELFRLKPEAAIAAMDGAQGFETLPRFEPLIRGLALFASGRVDEALAYSLQRRRAALRNVDQFSLVTQSYVASLALLSRGLFDEAEYLMGWAFSLKRPGFLLGSLYNAMLRLSALRADAASSSLGEQATAANDVGPLPGIGKGVYELVARKPASAEAFDQRASTLLAAQKAHGFILEAVYSGLFALCLLPTPRVKSRLEKILREQGITRHDQLLRVASAVLEGDIEVLDRFPDEYEPDGDAYQIAMLLRGAVRKHRVSSHSGPAVVAIERAAERFMRKHRPDGQFIAFEPGVPYLSLTDREREIALLAGTRTNQEIADQFGLSIRTVESHISNALRKTNAASRRALFDLVRGDQ
ncbi:LuxR C-terminal-related transcriptional regulator [Sinomonas terrae]|uniref:LuxR C-terminal-related transcriptional regulator n=1 Tax=Sinomonas terrae TaxID=2908838 RepID=A0ABS9U666_9MICC|nr:LuxR C-terminal-related transcriptional regulator [Sinomonas terrae]MCH6472183.1 LuxR C-terminal-related transcriptional regulator [Sinomonas terrae]